MIKQQPVQRKRGPGRLTVAETALLHERLLTSAEEVFVEQGYARTTMEQIALRAGIGRKTLYSRFANKGEVLAAVVNRLLDTAMAQSSKREDSGQGDARSQLLKMARNLAGLSQAPHVAGINRLIFAEAPQEPKLAALFLQLHEHAATDVQAKLEELHAQGVLPRLTDSRMAAVIFIEMTASIPRLRALLGMPLTRKETNDLIDVAVDIFLQGLRHQGCERLNG